MAVSFLPQAQIRAGNPLLDLAQLNQGLASVQKSNELQADRALREQQMAATTDQQNRLIGLQRDRMAMDAQQNAASNRRADETMSMKRQQFNLDQDAAARARQREDDMRQLQGIMAGAEASIENPALWQSIRQRNPDIDRELPPEIAADPQATLRYIRTKLSQSGETTFGRSAAMMQDANGNFYTLQVGSDGSRRIMPAQTENGVSLQPARGVTFRGDTAFDSATARPIANIASAIEGEKEAEILGKARGEAKTSLGKDIAEAEDALNVLEMSLTHPGREWASGRGTWLPDAAYANTPGAGWIAIVNQIKGKTFLQAYQSLRGGGQITEVEGKKAEQAIARIDRALTPEDFTAAVEDLRDVIKRGVERAKASAGESQANAAPAAVRGAGGGGGTRPPPPPAPGTVMDGYEFIGGDPKDRNNWRLAQ